MFIIKAGNFICSFYLLGFTHFALMCKCLEKNITEKKKNIYFKGTKDLKIIHIKKTVYDGY